MIQVTPHMRVLVAVEPVDFRCGIDGLARRVREVLASDPLGGVVYLFRNRRGTAVKLLVYDGQGFWLCQKRLSTGHFRYWPASGDAASCLRPAGAALEPHELSVLLSGGDFRAARGAPLWRRIG